MAGMETFRATLGSRRKKAASGSLNGNILVSLCLHLALIAGLLHLRPVHVAPVRLPGTKVGSRMLLTYSPGRAPAQTRATLKDPHRPALKTPVPKPDAKQEPSPVLAAVPSPPSANPDSSTGNDGLGTGDVNIALLSYFPVPRPDLTQLPHGTRGDVVIDIVIDANGKIVQLKMSKGVGYGVDEAVLATVQQWTFHPATKDGRPVASEQELLFHYERS